MADEDKTPHPVDIYVGQRLRNARKGSGFSQTDLAASLGITFQQIQKYERGANRISSSKLFEAAQFLKKDISYFYPPVDEPFLTDGRPDIDTAVAEIGADLILALAGISAGKRRAISGVIESYAA